MAPSRPPAHPAGGRFGFGGGPSSPLGGRPPLKLFTGLKPHSLVGEQHASCVPSSLGGTREACWDVGAKRRGPRIFRLLAISVWTGPSSQGLSCKRERSRSLPHPPSILPLSLSSFLFPFSLPIPFLSPPRSTSEPRQAVRGARCPRASTGEAMTNAGCRQIRQRIARLERASALFDRHGALGAARDPHSSTDGRRRSNSIRSSWSATPGRSFSASPSISSLRSRSGAPSRSRRRISPHDLLRDFALFVLPALVAAGGWLYALSLRKQPRQAARAMDASRHDGRGASSHRRKVQLAVASCARTDARKCS